MTKGFTSVSVPKEIVTRARAVLDLGGYTSVGELIRDAVRRRIEVIESEINKKHTKKKSKSASPPCVRLTWSIIIFSMIKARETC